MDREGKCPGISVQTPLQEPSSRWQHKNRDGPYRDTNTHRFPHLREQGKTDYNILALEGGKVFSIHSCLKVKITPYYLLAIKLCTLSTTLFFNPNAENLSLN